ncbi:MAG: OmpA family protein [bacterium]|nr:OmpA family protein [bacterium]
MRKRLNDTGVSLRRVDNRLKLVLPGNLTFKVGQSTLNPSFREVLGTVADLLKFYEKTLIEISGHSDSSGGPAMNERLSLQRAQTVAVFLVERGVQTMRIYSQGIADRLPIASNDSKEGRALNRRVELFLVPLVE